MAGFDYKQKKNREHKSFRYEDSPEGPQGKPDLASMVRKIQQQLVFLERKIDMLLGQSSSSSFRQDGKFARAEGKAHKHGFADKGSYKGKKPFLPKRKPRI